MAKAAFIGLGVMGYHMAAHLQNRGGHEVTVYNRTAAKAEKWVAEHGGAMAQTPADAARDADFIFACVGRDEDLWAVTVGPGGAFETMKPGAIFIDNTTASADIARKLHAAAAEKQCGFIDAPISGGEAGAVNGVLTVMCGGDEETFAQAKPIIESYAKMVGLMGPVGSGQLTKMVNQICIVGLVQGLSEAIHFANQSGLDVEAVIDVISKGAAGSWQMENRHKTMIEGHYDHGFAVDWMRKDLAILLNEADRNGAALPVTALVDQFYKEIQNMGGNRWDTSSLLKRLQKLSEGS